MHDDDLDNESAKSEDGTVLPLCPHLALRDDPETRALYPRMDHVCRLPRVYPPSLQWQQRYCISQHYGLCPHYRVHGKDAPLAPPTPGRGSPMTWRRGVTAAGVLAVIGTGVMLTVANSAAGGGVAHTPTPGTQQTRVPTTIAAPVNTVASPVSAAPASAPPTAISTPATTEAPSPTPEPAGAPAAQPSSTPAPPVVSTPATAPAPSQPVTYVVAEGDTLASIANRYHVSVDTLITLNNISDPNVIHAGSVLKLPTTP